MSRPKKKAANISSQDMRETLEADVRAYLASGNKIEQVPTGFTNQNPLRGRRQLVLGPGKKS
ncbi:MAG: hypothetical protein O7H39_18600 [Gammaproteobacteria bacterium]|jgi:hypothetical protein|nr:hypothetical protein [Gammaproteobacteria bacterium]